MQARTWCSRAACGSSSPGVVRVWVEGPWQISPHSTVVGYSGERSHGRGLGAAVQVGEAGRVALPRDVAPDPRVALRLLHAGTYREGKALRWELSRRQATSEVGPGLLMPVGQTLGALWDERSRSYTAISRPFEVKARQTVSVPLGRPLRAAHLVAQVQRPMLAGDAEESKIGLLLRRGGKTLRPDLQIPTADKVYAVWYDLPPGPVELRAESKQGFLEPQRLDLTPGRIARLLAKVRPWKSWSTPRGEPATSRLGPD